MEERESGLIGGEIDSGAAIERDNDRILDDACAGSSVDLSQFHLVSMQMHGMGIVGAVAVDETVPCSLLKDELLVVRVRFAVYEPGVELARPSGNLLEDHFDGVIGGASRSGVGIGEHEVIPAKAGGLDPLRLAVLVRVLDDDTQTGVAMGIFDRAEDPNAGVVHLHDGVDALGGSYKQGFD